MEWMKKCYICGNSTEEEVHIIRSIVPLKRAPEYADKEYVHEYPVCHTCWKKKELI